MRSSEGSMGVHRPKLTEKIAVKKKHIYGNSTLGFYKTTQEKRNYTGINKLGI